MSLGGFERKTKRTRKHEFLDEMNLVVPWTALVSLIAESIFGHLKADHRVDRCHLTGETGDRLHTVL